jgi:hypothetical protein
MIARRQYSRLSGETAISKARSFIAWNWRWRTEFGGPPLQLLRPSELADGAVELFFFATCQSLPDARQPSEITHLCVYLPMENLPSRYRVFFWRRCVSRSSGWRSATRGRACARLPRGVCWRSHLARDKSLNLVFAGLTPLVPAFLQLSPARHAGLFLRNAENEPSPAV